MAKDITIKQINLEDVPAIDVPQIGGGIARFVDTSDANATADKIQQGFSAYVDAVKLEGTGSGGGGASNFVAGTFNGATTNVAMDIDIPYTGSGYPIAVMIWPTKGPYNRYDKSFYNLVHQYALTFYFLLKCEIDVAPTYSSSTHDYAIGGYRYKSGSSSSSSYSGGSMSEKSIKYVNSNASADSATSVLVVRSNKKLSVYISAPGSYGFAANIEYTYHVIYSS